MIIVHTPDGDSEDFEDATRFSTDEFNNLCLWGGRKQEDLLACIHASHWVKVQGEHDDQG